MKLPRPLPKLLFTDRDSATKKFSGKSVDWQDWNSYINDLVCRCAKEAKVRNYAYFSIQFYGKWHNHQQNWHQGLTPNTKKDESL